MSRGKEYLRFMRDEFEDITSDDIINSASFQARLKIRNALRRAELLREETVNKIAASIDIRIPNNFFTEAELTELCEIYTNVLCETIDACQVYDLPVVEIITGSKLDLKFE